MALAPNTIFLRQTNIGVLIPALPLLVVTGCVSSPLPAFLLIPLFFSAVFATFVLYRNKKGLKAHLKAQLLMDAVLSFTYLGLLMPIWIDGTTQSWYNISSHTKLESYSCAFAMISMTIHIWFTLSGLYSLIRKTFRNRGLLSRECPTCRARENEEARGLLERGEPASLIEETSPTVMMKDGARYMLVDTDATPRSSEDIRRTFGEGEA